MSAPLEYFQHINYALDCVRKMGDRWPDCLDQSAIKHLITALVPHLVCFITLSRI